MDDEHQNEFVLIQNELLGTECQEVSCLGVGRVEEIPDEIWNNILVRCDVNTLVIMRKVSRKFRRYVSDELCLRVGWEYTKKELMIDEMLHYCLDIRIRSEYRNNYMIHVCLNIELMRILSILDEHVDLILLINRYDTTRDKHGGFGRMMDLAEKYPNTLREPVIMKCTDGWYLDVDGWLCNNSDRYEILLKVIRHAVDCGRPIAMERLINVYGKYDFKCHVEGIITQIGHRVDTSNISKSLLDVLVKLYPTFTIRPPIIIIDPRIRDYIEKKFYTIPTGETTSGRRVERHLSTDYILNPLPDDSDEMDLVNG